ncbi:MAG: TetR/AcrR family transcriptional regulator [Oscillospiraceae bacterium]|nr:TetR/AcrR family transcriptional regulator [Oscillospiraceae bacterium]
MYKHCNTEESARRQRQLEQCLLDLMADIPYSGITIGQICEQAGISRKSFYRYFDSKDGCLYALLDHTIMDCSTYCMPRADAVQFELSLCIRIFEYWQQQTQLLNALERNGQSTHVLQRIIRYIITEEPEYARYMGIARSNVMEHIVFTVSGIMGLVLTWHHTRYQKTAAQMGELLYQMMQRN